MTLNWTKTPGGAYEAGDYFITARADGLGWNANAADGRVIQMSGSLEDAKAACEADAADTDREIKKALADAEEYRGMVSFEARLIVTLADALRARMK